jgi:hypothetical protein
MEGGVERKEQRMRVSGPGGNPLCLRPLSLFWNWKKKNALIIVHVDSTAREERTGRKTEESQCGSPPLPFWIFAGSSTIPHFLALTTQTTRRRNLPGLGLGKKDGCHLYDRICRKSTQAINEWPCQLLSYSTPPVSIMGVILFV